MGRPSPVYWWDFVDSSTAIIVQSDYKGGQELDRFEIIYGNSEAQIEKAENVIADYYSGRKTPKWDKANDC